MLIRNPWGMDAGYTGKWSDGDTASWTDSAKKQVPYINNDNDGLFFIEDTDFIQAFPDWTISFYRDGWTNNIAEVVNDQSTVQRRW